MTNREGDEGGAHWDATRQNTADITELKTSVASIEAGVAGLQNQVSAGFAGITQQMSVVTREKPPINWVAIGAVLLSLVVMFGTFFQNNTMAQQRENDLRFDHISSGMSSLSTETNRWLKANTDRMSEDDHRERSDAAARGSQTARLTALEKNFAHMRGESHQNHQRAMELLMDLRADLERGGTNRVVTTPNNTGR